MSVKSIVRQLFTHRQVAQYGKAQLEQEFGAIEAAFKQIRPQIFLVAGNFTVPAIDCVVFVDATAGPVLIAILPPQTAPAISVIVVKSDGSANAVTVSCTSSLISGAGSVVLAARYNSATLVNDGSTWYKTAST